YGAYFSNVLNITPGIMAMVSLRADYFDSVGEKDTEEDDYDQFALSPNFGLVYQPVLDTASIFASYMNAFINVAPQQVFDPDGGCMRVESCEPGQASQWEYAVKTNLFADRLYATVSLYDSKVSDRVYPDPSNPKHSVRGGSVGSKGVEFDLSAQRVAGLSV